MHLQGLPNLGALRMLRLGLSEKEPIAMEDSHWSKADVFFLQDAILRGMSVKEVASFLGKSIDAVQAKARELETRP